MILYVVRHATAQPVAGTITRDTDRPLTAEGETMSALMGLTLARVDPEIAAILTSPLLRARQTGTIFKREMHDRPMLRVTDNLAPGFRQKNLMEELTSLAGSGINNVVAIGHQPDLSTLIGFLVADSLHVAVAMSTLAIARIELETGSSDPQARLAWLLTPDVVNRIMSHHLEGGQ
jgi:phosphohistidine phosphatase